MKSIQSKERNTCIYQWHNLFVPEALMLFWVLLSRCPAHINVLMPAWNVLVALSATKLLRWGCKDCNARPALQGWLNCDFADMPGSQPNKLVSSKLSTIMREQVFASSCMNMCASSRMIRYVRSQVCTASCVIRSVHIIMRDQVSAQSCAMRCVQHHACLSVFIIMHDQVCAPYCMLECVRHHT